MKRRSYKSCADYTPSLEPLFLKNEKYELQKLWRTLFPKKMVAMLFMNRPNTWNVATNRSVKRIHPVFIY